MLGLIHWELFHTSQTIDRHVCLFQLYRVKQDIQEERDRQAQALLLRDDARLLRTGELVASYIFFEY